MKKERDKRKENKRDREREAQEERVFTYGMLGNGAVPVNMKFYVAKMGFNV